MNRRTFCLALATTAACGGRAPSTPFRPRPPAAPSSPPAAPAARTEVTKPYAHRERQSLIAFSGDLLAQSTGGGLHLWDSLAMTRRCTFRVRYASFCFLQDGSLVAICARHRSAGAAIHHLDPTGTLRSYDAPAGLDDARLLPAASPAEVYALQESTVTVLARVGARFEAIASYAFPHVYQAGVRSYSLGDGRMVVAAGDLMVLYRDGRSRSYATWRHPRHLAPATGQRCWYTLAAAHDAPIGQLVLARLDSPGLGDRTVHFGSAHIIDLAAAGTTAAVLLRDRAHARCAVALVDEDGRIRWRADVPPAHAAHGTLAVSAHRVVLCGLDDALLAWDAATGRRIDA